MWLLPPVFGDVMKNYSLGFSVYGLVTVALVMAPNILWMFFPPANDVLATGQTSLPLPDILENAGRIALFVLLVLLVNRQGETGRRSFLTVAVACLAGYYLLWGLYFAGIAAPALLVGMAVLPSACFLCVTLWLRNYIALVPALLFAATHICITCYNYL